MAADFRTRGIPQDWVELEHPDVEGTQTVHPSAVGHWEARGWKRAGGAKPAAAAKTASKEA